MRKESTSVTKSEGNADKDSKSASMVRSEQQAPRILVPPQLLCV